MAAKVRQRMEREEKEQAEQSAARLDKIDDETELSMRSKLS
jgi:hypothetical protein